MNTVQYKCPNCGAPMEDNAKFCPSCGAPVNEAPKTENQGEQNKNENFFTQLNDTPDTTADYTKEDIDKNKVMGVLAYLGLLVLVPLLAAKDSKFARFYSNQGLVLLTGAGICSVLSAILSLIPFWLIRLPIYLVQIALFVLAIIGIVNAASGKAKELPLIGKITILK